jgi:hypothetical protein
MRVGGRTDLTLSLLITLPHIFINDRSHHGRTNGIYGFPDLRMNLLPQIVMHRVSCEGCGLAKDVFLWNVYYDRGIIGSL